VVMRIKELRESSGMTQKCLAANMGVLQNTVSNWESEVALPRTRQLPYLARLFGCTVNDLFTEDALSAPVIV